MKTINSILCVVDPEDNSLAAVKQSVRLAEENQAKLAFISVIERPTLWRAFVGAADDINKSLSEAAAQKKAFIETWLASIKDDIKCPIDVVVGIGFIEIIKQVISQSHDLVVKCANDVDWLARLFASEDMHLLRKCPCPVLMLRADQYDKFDRVLATVDMNEDINELEESRIQDELNRLVLEYGTLFTLAESSDLHIGSVWGAYGDDFLRYAGFSHASEEGVQEYVEHTRQQCSEALDSLLEDMRSMLGDKAYQFIQPKIHLIQGEPQREIPKLVRDCQSDLLIMGTVARTGLPGFIIGNTAESILEQVQCSVLAIKPEGFKSPIKLE